MSAQRWYAVETHTHGKGNWTLRPRVHPSREHAKLWAESRGFVPREKAKNGKRGGVYRIVEHPQARQAAHQEGRPLGPPLHRDA